MTDSIVGNRWSANGVPHFRICIAMFIASLQPIGVQLLGYQRSESDNLNGLLDFVKYLCCCSSTAIRTQYDLKPFILSNYHTALLNEIWNH